MKYKCKRIQLNQNKYLTQRPEIKITNNTKSIQSKYIVDFTKKIDNECGVTFLFRYAYSAK